MTRFARTALVAALGLGAAGAAQAAPPSAAPMLGAAIQETSPLEEVRYVTRCRPVYVDRYDRFGRPVRVSRNVCRRVWVGGRGGYRRY